MKNFIIFQKIGFGNFRISFHFARERIFFRFSKFDFRFRVSLKGQESTKMSYVWDTTTAILSALLPASVTFIMSSYSHRRNLEAFRKGTSFLKWMDPRMLVPIDLSQAVLLGYAAYRVYKNGGGFENTDTAMALGYCGVNMLACLATTFNSKNIGNFEIFVYANISSSAVATALAFYKIDEVAGFCAAHYAVWTGCYFLLASYLRNEQKKHNKEE